MPEDVTASWLFAILAEDCAHGRADAYGASTIFGPADQFGCTRTNYANLTASRRKGEPSPALVMVAGDHKE